MQIELNDVGFAYDAITILRGVRIQIQKGEFIGIMGPNGGGKTTLLKILMGFLAPSCGKVQVKGTIGYVPQVYLADRGFPITVKELVLLGGLSKTTRWGTYPSEVKEAAGLWIDRLGLTAHQNKAFGSLSGGLAQRALLARALLSDPDLLLLDEPTANIDVASSLVIFNLLEELRGKKTVLLVTHDLKTVVERVDRILCVQGEVSSLLPNEICEHFALGLYHTPLFGLPPNHFSPKESHAQCTHR